MNAVHDMTLLKLYYPQRTHHSTSPLIRIMAYFITTFSLAYHLVFVRMLMRLRSYVGKV
jgi:hypothetical protein